MEQHYFFITSFYCQTFLTASFIFYYLLTLTPLYSEPNMNQQNQLLGLPIELLTRIFDNYLDFEDTVTVFHASRTWRNNLLPRLWSSERLERYQTLVPILWDLHAHELHRLRYTYYPDAPLVHPLHNPRVEFIDALAHFGSRHQNYHICNYKY